MRQTLDQIFSKLGVTPELIEQAHQRQTTQGGSIRKQLIALNVFTEETFARKVPDQLRVPYVNLDNLTVPDNVLALLPREQAEKYVALPLKLDERHRRLTMTMADPLDMAAINELQFVVGYTLILHYTPEDELTEAIQREYARFEAKQAATRALAARQGEAEIQNRIIETASLATVEAATPPLIGAILTVAYAKQASEIHLETDFEKLRIRFRIEGKMVDIAQFPKQLAHPLISRLKQLLGVESSEERPRFSQKGCATVKLPNKKGFDLSYQISATAHNEKVCLKLKERSLLLALDDFALEPEMARMLKQFLGYPHGLVLVTGKARSGLTTTLYALLKAVNKPQAKILSVEDPLECTIEGVTQGQVNEAAGYTYTQYLHHAFTQRPEALMIDKLCGAKMAQDALLLSSGSLVLSSLSAEDAASAAIKLALLTNPQLVANHVNCITSQRLVKKICTSCKEEVALPEAHREKLGFASDDHCYTGKGCEQCSYTGYMGLTSIFEVMPFTDDVKQAILDSCTVDELQDVNARYHLLSLRDDGMRKVKQGLTTVQEVLKATMS
jgi:type IV pilus assembly protein PilB